MSRKAARKAAAGDARAAELLAEYRARRKAHAWKFGREPVETSWWERTGQMSGFVDGISSPMLRNLTSGEIMSSRDLPAGALYALNNDEAYYETGADGLAIMCRLPDGEWWRIDSRASNCTMKDDTAHRCWVRHGTVGERLTVDKRGNSCKAGAGSIQTEAYHGFLEKGRLVLRRGG